MTDLYSLLPIVLLLVIFYLLVMRPARARQKDYQNTQAALEPGRRVMLASGIYGASSSPLVTSRRSCGSPRTP